MLAFFRRYERYFFIFITIIIICSFSIFGAVSTLKPEEKKKDRVLGRLVDGSQMMLSEVRLISKFIASDAEDRFEHGQTPNLCNDGVVRYDLLKSGVADLLVHAYFDGIKPEFDARLDQVKRFRPYAHPQIPVLSAEAVWKQFLPAMNRELGLLKGENEASVETFSLLSKLYQEQSSLTPDTLRRVLYFQHQHLGIAVDPGLISKDLSLFGFHSLSDWFGPDFLTLASEFILNAASLAEQKGFSVTLEEAKGDLMAHFQASIKKRSKEFGENVPTLSDHLRRLGFENQTAEKVWQRVLLFRKYFQSVSQAAFLDRLALKDFASFLNETAKLRLYEWPKELHFQTLQDWAEFEIYLSAVAPPLENPLDLPSSFYPPEKVAIDYPELVQSSYKVSLKTTSLGQLALRASLKEVWEWQQDETNWDILKGAFPHLGQALTREERFQVLQKLSDKERSEVDAFTRLRLIDLHPEWIEEALSFLPASEQIVSISKAGSNLAGVEKPWRLVALLERAELKIYKDNGKTLYSFETVEKIGEPHVLTFEDAKSQGLLSKVRERILSAYYLKIRSRFESKSFAEVQNEVVKLFLAKRIAAIEKVGKGPWSDDLYGKYRLLPLTEKAYRDLQIDPEDPAWKRQEGSLEEQFKLISEERSIQRTSNEEWMKTEAFAMLTNNWSPIRFPESGIPSFFYLVDKKISEAPLLEQISFGKALIAEDAERFLAERLLESIFQLSSINLKLEEES
jgi:GcvH upstream region-like protein